MTDAFSKRWDLSLGILAIVSCPILSFVFCWINSQRPSKKVRGMRELLKETESLFMSCFEEGLVKGAQAENYKESLER